MKIFTGGSGLLGNEMQKLYPSSLFPPSSVLNVTKIDTIENYIYGALKNNEIDAFIHMAAFTSPPEIQKDPKKAIDVNIIGTANIVKACMDQNIRLIYISTDYVFSGDKGNYSEKDSVYPQNKYAWSKLGGETAVRMYDNSVIIRLSFGPNEFPYPGAFIDQWTSRETVSTTAKKIKKIIDSDFIGIIHIGSERRSVYEYAMSIDNTKKINKMSIKDMSTVFPKDTSLNTYLYSSIFGED